MGKEKRPKTQEKRKVFNKKMSKTLIQVSTTILSS